MNDMDHTQILMNPNSVVWTQPPNLRPVLPPANRGMFLQDSQRLLSIASGSNQGRGFRKGKRPDMRRKDSIATPYKPSNWNELQYQNQNRWKSRRFHPKKKSNYRFPPFAPRNTTSFLIRAKRSGGIASLVSPYPVTPTVLPTPIFSPLSEVLVDMAREEWGLDGYGSMKGLIRLRSSKDYEDEDEEEDEGGGSGDSDVEGHLEVERRLDHDLSRFEMICPISGGEEQSTLLESRVDDQDFHIAQLEEENLALKERVFFMERELEDLRRRVQFLETEGWRLHLMDTNKEETAASESAFDNGVMDKSINDIGNE